MMNYTLNGHEPVEEPDVLKWAIWFEKKDASRVVRETEFGNGCVVSTVFLGIDHGFGFSKDPILFETMIFGIPRQEGYQERYSSWDEAVEGHNQAIEQLRSMLTASGLCEDADLLAELDKAVAEDK